MTYDCLDCNWTGDREELNCDHCPECNGEVVEAYDNEPHPDDDENQTFRNVEVSALCAEWNL